MFGNVDLPAEDNGKAIFFLTNPANPADYRKQSMGLFLALCLVFYDVLKLMFYYTQFISIIRCEMFKFVENYTDKEALGRKQWVSCAKSLTDTVV